MEMLLEKMLIYGTVIVLCVVVIVFYLRKQIRTSRITEAKIEKAKEEGLFEPVSLHPVVDPMKCMGSGACIIACPEKDILGIRDGKATTINASRCIGHGACFHACPTQAITLCIGTEKRGVELPHVSTNFETNVPGIYIAGELGGMGLIRNAVEQGRQAVELIAKSLRRDHQASFDLIIVGAGPAGISASLAAKKNNLSFLTLEQDTLGGTVFTFPRSKIVMTSAMDLPLYGKVKLYETSKSELLDLWMGVLRKNNVLIRENAKVESIISEKEYFSVVTREEEHFTARYVLLAIGRRGTPRKLGVPGEMQEKVAYRLLEPEEILGKRILVVGGGDSAVESALLLSDQNQVVLSYRSHAFSRLKPANEDRIRQAVTGGRITVMFNSNLLAIDRDEITLSVEGNSEPLRLENDLVYIFAGGELPTQFLQKAGIQVTKKFGEAIMKHS